MAIALVILVLALVGGYFLARRNWPQESRAFLLPLIGWVGGLLILVSLVFLPWVALGPAGAMAANADWIASQAAILETIQSIPAFESLLQGVEAPTGAELLASLDQPVTEKLLERRPRAALTSDYIARRMPIDYAMYVRMRGKLTLK